MATLVLDIETVGSSWDSFTPAVKNDLLKHCRSEEEKEQVKGRLALSPFTGRIASLAMFDIERKLGAVYFETEKSGDKSESESFTFKQRTEKEILEDFWEGAREYDIFATFNGRAFLLPFLHQRSIVNRVRPSVEISKARFITKQNLPYHVDLLDELTFNGNYSPRPSLKLITESYGIDYETEFSGVEIAHLHQAGEFRKIAERNASDVLAITKLYQVWLANLAPKSWLNTIENL